MKIKNVNVQLARAFVSKCDFHEVERMRDSDFLSMSSNRIFFKKNVRFQHFCLKMWAMEKWCVTKVAHCMVNNSTDPFEYLPLIGVADMHGLS